MARCIMWTVEHLKSTKYCFHRDRGDAIFLDCEMVKII